MQYCVTKLDHLIEDVLKLDEDPLGVLSLLPLLFHYTQKRTPLVQSKTGLRGIRERWACVSRTRRQYGASD